MIHNFFAFSSDHAAISLRSGRLTVIVFNLDYACFQPKHLNIIASYIVTMATTIQVSERLVDTLKKRRQYDKESYEEVIWDLVEDSMEVNEQTKREIERARADIKSGKFYTHEQVKKKLGL